MISPSRFSSSITGSAISRDCQGYFQQPGNKRKEEKKKKIKKGDN